MAKKRIRVTRANTEIVAAAKRKLDAIPTHLPSTPAELRKRVVEMVGVYRELREFGLAHVTGMLPYRSASERILEYLRLFPGTDIEGEELEVVSGISEYARRVREWRIEFGWPIKHEKGVYRLERNEPDASKADLWRTLNSIRRSGPSARDKMLAVFKALPVVTVVKTAQLRYVTEGKDMRRVRELRTQFGWRIMTRQTGVPTLKPGEYILADALPVEEHDRNIDDSTYVAVLQRDHQKCRKCAWHPIERAAGDPRQYIEVHHITYHVAGGSNELDNLITLCNVHHRQLHTEHVTAENLPNWLQAPS